MQASHHLLRQFAGRESRAARVRPCCLLKNDFRQEAWCKSERVNIEHFGLSDDTVQSVKLRYVPVLLVCVLANAVDF